MILSCKQAGGLESEIRNLIDAGSLPTITVELDSAEIVQKTQCRHLENPAYDGIKRDLIAQAYHEHLSLSPDFVRAP